MNGELVKQDLVVVVADKNMESAIRGILSRTQSLHIRNVKVEIHVHIERDPGCYHKGHIFLRPFSKQFGYSMILFDRVGSGQENRSRNELEREVEENLRVTGWAGRSAAVVIEPELENWVWSESSQVDRVLGWEDRSPDLRTPLIVQGWLTTVSEKPRLPKEALEWSLRRAGRPRSSAIYEELGSVVSFERCVDPAFLKLKQCLQEWFGEG